MSEQQRCLVIYDHLPHYRYGVFRALEEDCSWRFTFAADAHSRNSDIVTIPFESLRRTQRLKNVWLGPFLWQRGAAREVLKGYDAVIFLGSATHISTWVGAALARMRGARVLYWTIGWHRPEHGIKRLIRVAFYRLAHSLLLYGSDARAIGGSVGYPVRRMRVIGNSGESSASAASAEAVAEELAKIDGLPLQGRSWVGAVVRVNPEKRFDLLLDAIASLRRDNRDVGILIVGDGPAVRAIRSRADELGVPVCLPGAVHSALGLSRVYSELKVSVLPERAGLTVMQSLSYGVPVVSVADPFRQVPEFRAIVPGVTGELYSPDDVVGLAAAVERALDAVESDPQGIANACRDEVTSKWSPRVHADAILSVLGGRG